MSTPLTKEQALIITGYTMIHCCQSFGDFHADVERRLNMPVFTHQFPDLEDQIKDAYRDDFMAMLKAGYADESTLAAQNSHLNHLCRVFEEQRDSAVDDANTWQKRACAEASRAFELEQALAKCVASLDQLLPYLAKVPADVGLLNDALRAARPLLKQEPAPAQDEQSPEQMLSQEQIENIARNVYRECCLLPGATFQHAAEVAVMYTLELIARRQWAEPECGNCFEGKSDMDHVCRKCGGSGKAEPAPAQDELLSGFCQWYRGKNGYAPYHPRGSEGAEAFAAGAEWQRNRPAQTEQQPVAVPEGWKLVPVQPTAEMLAAVTTSTFEPLRQEAMKMAREDYQAMLYAAPIAQTAQRGEA